jgi:hypothetical protein
LWNEEILGGCSIRPKKLSVRLNSGENRYREQQGQRRGRLAWLSSHDGSTQ